MSQELRRELLGFVARTIRVNGEGLTLQGAVQATAQSLAKVVDGEAKRLALPDH